MSITENDYYKYKSWETERKKSILNMKNKKQIHVKMEPTAEGVQNAPQDTVIEKVRDFAISNLLTPCISTVLPL